MCHVKPLRYHDWLLKWPVTFILINILGKNKSYRSLPWSVYRQGNGNLTEFLEEQAMCSELLNVSSESGEDVQA